MEENRNKRKNAVAFLPLPQAFWSDLRLGIRRGLLLATLFGNQAFGVTRRREVEC